MEKTLEQLYAEHTGKVSDKLSLYLSEYDRLFLPYRNRPVRILEIGIQNGGSLEIWSKFFPQATRIIGCDIDPACAKLRYDDPKISVVVGNATSEETARQVLALSSGFDIIIDDGSHVSEEIVKAFARYFPHLADDGLFVAEDLHCSYWKQFQGGLLYPYSSMAFFKRLADIANHEHWGNNQPRGMLLRSFANLYKTAFDEELLAHVHSVEFANSMCTVRKMKPEANVAGYRVPAGTEEAVATGHLPLRGSACLHLSQTENEWSMREMTPEEELPLRFKQIMELSQALAERDQQIARLTQALAERDRG